MLILKLLFHRLHGSYEALKGGSQAEAMEDFTGGLTERFDLTKPPSNLLDIMLKGVEKGSLMGCALDAGGVIEGQGPLGLITGHAYSVTAVKMVNIKTARTEGKIPLGKRNALCPLIPLPITFCALVLLTCYIVYCS